MIIVRTYTDIKTDKDTHTVSVIVKDKVFAEYPKVNTQALDNIIKLYPKHKEIMQFNVKHVRDL